MKLLLDTHAFLWLVEGSERLTEPARDAVADPENDLFLSSASVWEISIKTASRKLTLSDPPDIFVSRWTATYGIAEAPIGWRHALATRSLPDLHRDPFDRMLVAQARLDDLVLVSGDAKISSYDVRRLW